jgi:hypothetical protein
MMIASKLLHAVKVTPEAVELFRRGIEIMQK